MPSVDKLRLSHLLPSQSQGDRRYTDFIAAMDDIRAGYGEVDQPQLLTDLERAAEAARALMELPTE